MFKQSIHADIIDSYQNFQSPNPDGEFHKVEVNVSVNNTMCMLCGLIFCQLQKHHLNYENSKCGTKKNEHWRGRPK